MDAIDDAHTTAAARALEEREALPISGTAPVAGAEHAQPVAVAGKIVFHRPVRIEEVPTAVAVPGRIVFHQRTHTMRRSLRGEHR